MMSNINTNENAKKEAIKKSYGEKWHELPNSVKYHLLNVSNGFIDISTMGCFAEDLGYENEDIERNCEFWRPLKLKGIENNNGWIRIEPDGSNLPKNEGSYKTGYFDGGGNFCKDNGLCGIKHLLYRFYERSFKITHYKTIDPVLPPIY